MAGIASKELTRPVRSEPTHRDSQYSAEPGSRERPKFEDSSSQWDERLGNSPYYTGSLRCCRLFWAVNFSLTPLTRHTPASHFP